MNMRIGCPIASLVSKNSARSVLGISGSVGKRDAALIYEIVATICVACATVIATIRFEVCNICDRGTVLLFCHLKEFATSCTVEADKK